MRILLVVTVSIIYCYLVCTTKGRSIYIWDEAIYANNSLEMAKNNSYWVYTVGDTVDHHNTKPPLVLWCQALSIKALGYHEFSVRLPTYLAMLGTLFLLVIYSRKLCKTHIPGLLGALFLLTNYGAVRNHVFLSGDLDGVLVFFTTWITLHFIYCLQKREFKNYDYCLLTILFSLGYLTKSTAILLIVPSLAFCLAFSPHKEIVGFVINRKFLLAFTGFITLVILFYLSREAKDPGYWKIVWFSEFTRLTTDVQPWLHYPRDHYFQNFYHVFSKAYFLLLLLLLLPYLVIKDVRYKTWVFRLLGACVVYLVVISIPETKLEWYDAPIYPLMSAAIGIMVYEIVTIFSIRSSVRWIPIAVAGVFIAVFVGFRFKELQKRLQSNSSTFLPEEVLANGIRNLFEKYPSQKAIDVFFPFVDTKHMHTTDAMAFYKKVYVLRDQKQINLTSDLKDLQRGDTVLLENKQLDSLTSSHQILTIDSNINSCSLVKLIN